MKQKPYEDFKAYAGSQLAAIYGMNDYERVLANLREPDDVFRGVTPAQFGPEYLAARLALACHAWARSCGENYVEDSKIENLFFKTVMNSFQSDKFVSIATAFSEYLHAPEADKKSLLAVCLTMMKRLGIGSALIQGGKPVIVKSFETLMAVGESFKDDFENQFFDFVFSDLPPEAL